MQEDENIALSAPPGLPAVVPRKLFFDMLRDRLPHGAAHVFGALASVALFAVAAYILANVLSSVRISDVIEAVKATSGGQILAALPGSPRRSIQSSSIAVAWLSHRLERAEFL